MPRRPREPRPGEEYWVFFVREYLLPILAFAAMLYYLVRHVLKPAVELRIWRSISRGDVEDNPEAPEASAMMPVEEEVKDKND
ncbi:hypothetical protein DIPPA_30069 [Diplonema papillatum]|nr:hypothetical protein DIPPA_30069 [Diplonema papillatum]